MQKSWRKALIAAFAISVSAGAVHAAGLLVKEKTVPDALVPKTTKLLFPEPANDGGVRIERFRMQGMVASCSPDGKWIAYDCKHKDGYYNIHVCRFDGTQDRCLTTADNGLPHRHAGSPAWHPSGRYIVFTAEKKVHHGISMEAIPGFGGRSDLWVASPDGRKAWRLSDLPDNPTSNVLIPKFSHDGRHLVWGQRRDRERWEIKLADFVDSASGPLLKNERTFAPVGPGMYETYGFSPNDKRIIFMRAIKGFISQIYTMGLDGSDVRQLTDQRTWNEHASYTPDGRHIVWMTGSGSKNHGTDWWIMRSDGSSKKRLTHFNEQGYPEGSRRATWALLPEWLPGGKQFVGGVEYSLILAEARLMLVHLDASCFP